jgi:hypothetical protein
LTDLGPAKLDGGAKGRGMFHDLSTRHTGEGEGPSMKAFQINECDVYAGENLEEAIEASMHDTGNTREETLDDGYGQEVDGATQVRLVD